jgi:hypothetical protein
MTVSPMSSSAGAADAPTVITASNIPTWHVADTVHLNAYLAEHAQRTVIRIFAREVIVDDDVSLQASLSRQALDLRIDCSVFTIAQSAHLDLSGANTALGWKTYAPQAQVAAQAGDKGYEGGAFTLYAQRIQAGSSTQPTQLTLNTQGGCGGQGQAGYPGQQGKPGQDGHHFTTRAVPMPGSGGDATEVVEDPGSPPTDGGQGEAGTAGGQGGDGGDSGPIVIRSMWSAAEPFVIPALPAPAGGVGGAKGPGGAGGPAGQPTWIITDGNISDATESHAQQGPNGPDGPAGTPGNPGSAMTPDIQNITDGRLILLAMQADTTPHSLEVRAHQLFDACVTAWAHAGPTQPLDTLIAQVQWLHDLAVPEQCDFPSVVARYQSLLSVPRNVTMLTPQSAAIPAKAYQAGIQQMSTVGTASFTQNRPTWAAVADHHAQADSVRQHTLSVLGNRTALTQSFPSFYATAQTLISQAAQKPPGAFLKGDIELTPITGAVEDTATCETVEAATVEEVCVSELAMGPEGFIASATIAVLYLAFGSKLNSWLMGAESAQQKAYENDLAVYESERQAWENAEQERALQDILNRDHEFAENKWAQQRRLRDQRKNDYETPIRLYGLQYVGTLVDITPSEDGSGAVYVTLDGFLMPAINNPAALASFLLATYRSLSFLMTFRVPQGAPDLVEGQWYTLEVAPGSPDNDSKLETAIRYLRPQVDSQAQALVTLGLLLLPPVAIVPTAMATADPALAKSLDFLLGYQEIPTPTYLPKGWSPAAPHALAVLPAITSLTALNVGQGAFHVLRAAPPGGTERAYGAADMGGSSTAMTSPTVLAALVELVNNPQAPVVFSHWDADHYRVMANLIGQQVQATNPVIGPAVYIRGETLVNLLRAIASHGAPHLLLVGSHAASVVTQLGSIATVPTWAQTAGLVNLPSNVSVTLTTKMDDGVTQDRNNTEAMVVRVSGATNQVLLPGDASYSYILASEKQHITILEATHHGSLLSLLSGTQPPQQGTVQNNDIPPAAGAKQAIFSTNGSYHHGIDLTGAYYQAKGWSHLWETLLQGDFSINL